MISADEFWNWAYSDFLSNAQRGVVAEYLVSKALGCTGKRRSEWDAFDLLSPSGIKIEVKSSGYVQSWGQESPSPIRFDIAHKRSWHAESNSYSAEAVRPSDIYVFCVFAEMERDVANPLNQNQWFFLVCKTSLLNEKLPGQKSVALSSLEALGLARVKYESLSESFSALGANHSLQARPP